MPVAAGFEYDLFVSYAHLDNEPWTPGADGWITTFVRTLETRLKAKNREFRVWFDPQLRTADNYDLAIAKAISGSAVFLVILSPAFDNCPYCRKELAEFRKQTHPSFGLTVGTLTRMQAMLTEPLPEDRWPAEVRTTSPYRFYNADGDRSSRPKDDDEASPYVRGLGMVRASVWAVIEEIQKQKEKGTVLERSYDIHSQAGETAAVYLADVTDDLYYKREQLRTALEQAKAFDVRTLSDPAATRQSSVLSVHLMSQLAGRPVEGGVSSLSRLQLEAVLAANPPRRPLVWLPRDINAEDAEPESHRQFLSSLMLRSSIELLRMGFEDLKEEIQKRMRPAKSPVLRTVRRSREDPIVHIWYALENAASLTALRQYLKGRSCGISVFGYASESSDKLQAKLAFCDGLIVSYTSRTKSWAEDVMLEAFQHRRREERPLAYAAVQLPPPCEGEFNFEHPRVVPVRESPDGQFEGMDDFLLRLEDVNV